MPTPLEMVAPEPQLSAHAGVIGGSKSGVRLRRVPEALRADVDKLFADADQHGPRAQALVLRIVPALMLLAASIWGAMSPVYRTAVFEASSSADASTPLLVAPVLMCIVLLAGSMAPLTRLPTGRLVLAGGLLLGFAALVVHQGLVVAATIPAVMGGVLLGLGAARAVRRAVWVLPVLLAAGLSDARSVQGGLTHDLLDSVGAGEGAQQTHELVKLAASVPAESVRGLDYVVVHLPTADGLWVFGIVDVVAIALLLGLAHIYWRPVAASVIAFGVVVAATTFAGVPIPVLPLVGLAWALVNAPLIWRSTRFTARRLMYLGG